MPELNHYYLPNVARSLNPSSVDYMLANMNLRKWWHRIYDCSPELLTFSPPDGKKLLESFMQWGFESEMPFDWSLHFSLLNWLYENTEYKSKVTNQLVIALLAQSAQKWSLTDLKNKRAIVLNSPLLDDIYIAGSKPSNLNQKPIIQKILVNSKSQFNKTHYTYCQIDDLQHLQSPHTQWKIL